MPADKDPIALTDHHGRPLEKLPDECIEPVDADELPDGVLSETQIRLLDMMKRVHEFLNANGIEYYLFGGSLLGAIRHQGFIPWDDDMDIVMDRANYYKLVEISDDLPWDDIAFDCCEKNPGFHKPFGMFTLLSDTRFVNDRVYFGGAGLGTGIDVFIMDNVPFAELDNYLKTSLLYQEVQTDETIKCADIFKYQDEYFECIKREKEDGKAAEVARLRADMEKYGPKKEDDYQVVRLWAKKPRIYEPGMMEKPVLHKFEDAEFPVPERAVDCLRAQYGADWNVIPPHESRKIHAFKIDYELAACNYYRLVDRNVDWEEVSAALSKRKQSRLRALDKKQAVDAFRKSLYSKRKNNMV
jgi:lipopolysaccharide cholinephosphotransferase